MTKIPQFDDIDPTLEAADEALEEEYNANQRKSSGSIGMGTIGDSCSRKLWYRFRRAKKVRFNAKTVKAFVDGHTGEALQAERLRRVKGIELITHINDNQIEFKWFNGHVRGFCDGQILGLLQAPKSWHIWEHKQTNEKKLEKLKKLKEEKGEKNALYAWDPTYHAQAQLYMHFSGFSRHYMTIATPGGRETISCRTDYDKEYALKLLEKAESIIFTDDAPSRISNTPSWYECKFCDFQDICHEKKLPEINCKTCLHATAERQGGWTCAYYGAAEIVDEAMLCQGSEHLFLPGMLDGKIKKFENGTVFYEDGRVNYCGGRVE